MPKHKNQATNLNEPLYKHKLPASEYGEKYQDHLLEQYKLYVQMADKISERRQSANTFFLTINTVLIAFLGIVGKSGISGSSSDFTPPPLPWVLAVSIAGMLLSYSWYRLVRSYKGLNSGKFKVIHALENKLPSSPYDAEWETIGRGEKPQLYLPFTHVEIYVPWIFSALYVGFALWNITQAGS